MFSYTALRVGCPEWTNPKSTSWRRYCKAWTPRFLSLRSTIREQLGLKPLPVEKLQNQMSPAKLRGPHSSMTSHRVSIYVWGTFILHHLTMKTSKFNAGNLPRVFTCEWFNRWINMCQQIHKLSSPGDRPMEPLGVYMWVWQVDQQIGCRWCNCTMHTIRGHRWV